MLRNAYKMKPFIAILAGLMLMVALACAGDSATPTTQPTATSPAPTATPVPGPTEEPSGNWAERLMDDPGYNPEWGTPKSGGTFRFGANRDRTAMTMPTGGCYNHGCGSAPVMNRLLRIDPWIGTLDTVEGDLAESWDMSGDGLTLTFHLREGVLFQENPQIPAEYNGGKITGDEFVCEDAKASVERQAAPPDWETSRGDVPLYQHLSSVTCPDGPRGYTFVMNFDNALARTMNTLTGTSGMVMLDKDWIEWIDTEHENGLRIDVPNNFTWLHSTGPFIPVEFTPGVGSNFIANPKYFREGLPLVDKFENLLLLDQTVRFTALATGKIHYYGEGSFSLTPGQVEQAVRDFPDKINVGPQINMWASSGNFSTIKPPFDDVRVRLAVHLALDRKVWQAFRKAGPFEGTNLTYVMPPGSQWAPSEEEMLATWPGLRQPKAEDIAEANRLLDEVFGEGNRPNVACSAVGTDRISVDGCLYIVDQLKKNVDWEIGTDFSESAVLISKRERGGHDFNVWSDVSTSFLDPDDFFPSRYLDEFASATNKVMLRGLRAEMPEVMADVESMTRAQGQELDPVKRLKIVQDLEWKLFTEVQGQLVIGWRNMFAGWVTELKGWKSYDYHSNTKWPMFERIWLVE